MPLYSNAVRDAMSSWCNRVLFTDDCDILDEVRAPTPSGGSTSTWPVRETVRCAIMDAMTPGELAVAGQEAGVALKHVLMPLGTQVTKQSRLQIAGILYVVIDLFSPSSYELTYRVLAMRTTLPA